MQSERKLVEIHFVDILSCDTWMSKREAMKQKPIECICIGWLLYAFPHYQIYNQMTNDGDVSGVISIPSGCVTKIIDPTSGDDITEAVAVDLDALHDM